MTASSCLVSGVASAYIYVGIGFHQGDLTQLQKKLIKALHFRMSISLFVPAS